ncbi:hypothetical protein CCAX7_56630 [Capsulimonas corticalis]|uniref:Uncharacterized protein n=1 Tax=Capsulimonas corticalis TaxID=2219043 RepID=A0A402D0H1_9BACT|nr:hypothetical protein [Capsulimonas corticalis]BDI33612.1 hypothetical protein CCAX7_56630 [Capsulimonas corticalis]
MRHPTYLLSAFLLILFAAPSHAQLSYPALAPTPTPLHESPALGDLVLIDGQAPEEIFGGRRREVSVGYDDELTVRTDKAGRGVVDDFHSNGRYLALTDPISTRYTLAARSERTDIVALLNEGHSSDIRFAGRSTENAFELSFAGRRGVHWRIGAQEARLAAGGESDIYRNVFHFFTDTPPYRFQDTQRAYWIGAAAALRRGLWAELRIEQMDHPSNISLNDRVNGTSLTLPLGYRSQRYSGAIRLRLSEDWAGAAFVERWTGAGDGDVRREGNRRIGGASNEMSGDQTGLIFWRRLSGTRRLGLSYGEYHTIWSTHGVVPSGGDLSLGIPFVNAVRYDARTRVRERAAGVDWDHAIGAAHRLHLGYRWLEAAPYAEANDSASLLIIDQNGHTQTNTAALHAHVVQAAYSFPFHGLIGSLGATQAIPIADKKHAASSAPSGPPAPKRTSYGGYRLDCAVAYPF